MLIYTFCQVFFNNKIIGLLMRFLLHIFSMNSQSGYVVAGSCSICGSQYYFYKSLELLKLLDAYGGEFCSINKNCMSSVHCELNSFILLICNFPVVRWRSAVYFFKTSVKISYTFKSAFFRYIGYRHI